MRILPLAKKLDNGAGFELTGAKANKNTVVKLLGL